MLLARHIESVSTVTRFFRILSRPCELVPAATQPERGRETSLFFPATRAPTIEYRLFFFRIVMGKRGKTPKKTLASPSAKLATCEVKPSTTRVVDEPSIAFVAALVVAYACAIIGVNTPVLLYPALQEAGIFAPSDVAHILSLQTFGTMMGKVFAGFVVDGFGGRRTFMVCMAMMGVVLSLMTTVHDMWSTAVLAFLIEVAFTPVYPSFVKFVTLWFPRTSLAKGFWVLSTTSRGSFLFAGTLYTYFLGRADYTYIFWFAAALTVVGLLVACFLLGDAPFAQTYVAGGGLSKEGVLKISAKAFSSKSFYLAITSYSLHNCIKRMAEIMGVYLVFQCRKLVNHVNAPIWSSSFTLGLLVSILGVGYFYQQMAPVKKTWAGITMNSFGVVSSLGLSYLSNSAISGQCSTTSDLLVVATLVFLVGFSVGLTFYVPPGVFCVRFGGEKHSAAVSALMDVVASLLTSASFFGIKCLLDSTWEWSGVWLCVGVMAFANTIVSYFFLPIVWDDSQVKTTLKKHAKQVSLKQKKQ